VTRQLGPEDLGKVVLGDLETFSRMVDQKHESIIEYSRSLPSLVLRAGSVRRVLRDLLHHRASPAEAQRWASFIRRGYIAGIQDERVTPIQISYDPADEHQLADIVSRLDELGDSVDGEISPEELEAMIASLPASDGML